MTRRWSPWLLDAGLAVLFLVGGQVEATVRTSDGITGPHAVVNHVLGVLLSAPLVMRQRAPLLTMCLMSGGAVALSLGWEHSLYFWSHLLPMCFAVYPAARLLDGAWGRWSWTLGVVSLVCTMLRTPASRELSNVVFAVLVLGGCALAGRLVRRATGTRRELRAALRRLDEEHRAAEDAAVRSERARIAVEVQDVVAHALGLMLVQVGAARLGLERDRLPVPEQLRAAETTGRRALGELRRSVGLLGPGAPTEPMPGLEHLPELAAGFRSAGLDVRLRTTVADDLPTGLQLTVYRLLQESLTNALRHAGPVRVEASVEQGDDRLLVEGVNPVRRTSARPAHSGGHGLVGMRQRVAMFDGDVRAGCEGDRFVVRATLVVPRAADLQVEVPS